MKIPAILTRGSGYFFVSKKCISNKYYHINYFGDWVIIILVYK